MSLNNMVILIGYVGKDLVVREIKNGKKVSIRVATHEFSNRTGQVSGNPPRHGTT